MQTFAFPLPIDGSLPAIRQALSSKNNAVLVAPPGAGKSARVPLALMDEDWVGAKKIIMLEPRRLAARAIAQRLAETIGEKLGATIGLRIRMESISSTQTRLLVVTEGVFARMILDDPALEGVAAVIFDEFHERSLDADLGLALALDAQQAFCENLRILVMSATLDGARVAALMGNAGIIESEGRAFPVATHYLGRDPEERIERAMRRAILRALKTETGSILAFLPGQGEIERLADLLREALCETHAEALRENQIVIAPLYGALDKRAQDLAISACAKGVRKIVLATSVAETSLTIEGVRIVIDSGLSRQPRYEPDIGLTRLETLRASRAAVDQRQGRAGRIEPGVCYRLWEEAATKSLPAFADPEIMSADLSGLALDLAEWGVRTPNELRFLDAPPAPAWNEAQKLLRRLGALDEDGAIARLGHAICALPLPPRLARMVLASTEFGQSETAAQIALLLSERGIGGDSVDLADRLDRFLRDASPRAKSAKNLARGWAAEARRLSAGFLSGESIAQHAELSLGALVSLAFPERVARARGQRGIFLMANGRAAALEPHLPLADASMVVIAEAVDRAGQARIRAAATIELAEIDRLFGDSIVQNTELYFDKTRAALKATSSRKLGAIFLEERNLAVPPGEKAAHALAQGIADLGVRRLPWTPAQVQLRARAQFLRKTEGAIWPDVSDNALRETIEEWLVPYITEAKALSDVTAESLGQALSALLPWDIAQRLERAAPSHFQTPAGSNIPIDYEAEGGPAIHVRAQELFGLKTHPVITSAKMPLTLHLTSPAHRPIQITRDLPSFWKGSWSDVRANLRGRYPRHPWPEDPANAQPTSRAKPRGT